MRIIIHVDGHTFTSNDIESNSQEWIDDMYPNFNNLDQLKLILDDEPRASIF